MLVHFPVGLEQIKHFFRRFDFLKSCGSVVDHGLGLSDLYRDKQVEVSLPDITLLQDCFRK